MKVTVRPYRRGGWEFDISIEWPSGEKLRERRLSPLSGQEATRKYAEKRARHLYDEGPPSRRVARLTWDKFWVEFKRLHFTGGPRGPLKPSQTISIESHWVNHIQPFWGARDLEETSPRLIIEWTAALQEPYDFKTQTGRKRSNKTINNILTTFNTMLNRAEAWELAPRGLPRAKLFRLAKPEIEFYTFEQFRRLEDAASAVGEDAVLVVELGARAGLRAGEILALAPTDVHAVKDELLIQRSTWYGHTGTPKGGKPRRVPISAQLAKAIRLRRGLFVLSHGKGQALTIRRLRSILQAVERAAGFMPATGKIHKLRHTYASHLVMLGVAIAVVRELLGHEHIETTMRYAHLAPTAKDAAVAILLGDRQETIPAPRTEPARIRGKVERETGFEPARTPPSQSRNNKDRS